MRESHSPDGDLARIARVPSTRPFEMAAKTGLEPVTPDRQSSILPINDMALERPVGIEPTSSVWKTVALPLSYGREVVGRGGFAPLAY